MNSYLLLTYLVMAATLGRALLVAAKLAPSSAEPRPRCRRCRLPLERRALGEQVCGCGAHHTA